MIPARAFAKLSPMKRALVMIGFLTATLGAARGEPARLDADGLRAAYAGKTHVSFYRDYVADYGGLAFEETYRPDGGLVYRAAGLVLEGTWRVDGGTICFDYPATPLNSGCFAVSYEDGCYYSYQIGPDGAPVGLASGGWWIRAHIKGTEPACAAAGLTS